ncbi:MAG: IS630 family transposase [Chloroflexi bacterium]|nr:IS630 family transposase [Chloroflexota bacterium]
MPRKKIYEVNLSKEEREHLVNLVSSGTEKARKLTRARILLKADEDWIDKDISEALNVGRATVERIRKKYFEEDLAKAINRKPSSRQYEHKIDGKIEAHLIALSCGEAPKGYADWSLRLLADRLVKLEQVDIESISHETVRQVLKKTRIKPWLSEQWVIPPEANAHFVCAMEDILDLYHEPYDPMRPVVCFDEATKQLIAEKRAALPMKPGQPQRYDYEYERLGTANIFMFSEPLAGWRHVEVTDQRTMIDYAHCMKYLVDERYPEVEIVRVVQDNLNTHTPASLYKAFPPEEAHRILQRLEFHYTPKHGSWLNIAEIELSVLGSQCLNRRIDNKEFLIEETTAWNNDRNENAKVVDWQFTTEDARIKLKRLYPSFHS